MSERSMEPTVRVLFVCAGNICRSAMAEAFMRRLIAERTALDRVEVCSAGTIATDGNGPLSQTVSVMRANYGLDVSAHRARRLRRTLRADLVLAVDRDVAEEARAIVPDGEVQLLGDYAGSPGEEVADPYGGSLEDHARCAAQVERLVGVVAARLAREAGPAGESGA